LGKKDDD
jgi:hypothetical protein